MAGSSEGDTHSFHSRKYIPTASLKLAARPSLNNLRGVKPRSLELCIQPHASTSIQLLMSADEKFALIVFEMKYY